MSTRKIPDAQKAERDAKIFALKASGLTTAQIGQRFGLNRTTVAKILNTPQGQAA